MFKYKNAVLFFKKMKIDFAASDISGVFGNFGNSKNVSKKQVIQNQTQIKYC